MKSQLTISSICGNFLRALESPRLWYLVKWEEREISPRLLALMERKSRFIHTISCSSLKETSIWSAHLNQLLGTVFNLVHVNLAFFMVLYNLDWLENCPHVRNLIVTSCPNLSSMSLVRVAQAVPNLIYLECMNNGLRVIALQIVEIASVCTKLTHLNCYGTGNMHYWMAKEILESCPDMQVFYLSSNHIFDESMGAMGWFKLTRCEYKHVLFSKNIICKVEEYMDINRQVSYQAWLDFQEREAMLANE